MIRTNTHKNIIFKGARALDSSIFAVFDGHGGSRAAQFCKDNLIRHLVSDDHFGTDMAMAMKNAFHL